MSIDDTVMRDWFTLLTRVPLDEVEVLLVGHPRAAKARLAEEVTAFFHGADGGRGAREAFDKQFRDRELPSDIPLVAWPKTAPSAGLPLANLLKDLGLEKSTSDARRSIEGGGVKLDGVVVKDPGLVVAPPAKELLLQVGKRRFARVAGPG